MALSGRTRGPRRSSPTPPVAPSQDSLQRSALRYLERYDSSELNLRQVLERKARQALDAVDAEPELREAARAWVEQIVMRAVELRLVDDRRYAESLARHLLRRGGSHRATWQKLRHKGLSDELIREQLGAAPEPEAELAAASAHARRRRLGPWRSGEARVERRERDLAALARAGFGLDVARRVVDADSPDSLPHSGPRPAFA
jgi:regulatory protein